MEFRDIQGKFSFLGGTWDRRSNSGTVPGVSGQFSPMLYNALSMFVKLYFNKYFVSVGVVSFIANLAEIIELILPVCS